MLEKAGSGHSAGALGMSDIFAALYFSVLRHRPNQPDWEGRDYLILSNGHIVPVLYAAMAEAGYFPIQELDSLRKLGSRLQGHPERTALPGIETTSGPLGCGLSQASGMAYYMKYIQPQSHRSIYCLMGDGELNEGNIWEAALFAAKYRLNNITAIVDRNKIQIGGNTEDVMPLEDLARKWESFGWHTQEIDGNNIGEILAALRAAQSVTDRPRIIIANTIPGKGVDFMENDYHWHGKAPTAEEATRALRQLGDES